MEDGGHEIIPCDKLGDDYYKASGMTDMLIRTPLMANFSLLND